MPIEDAVSKYQQVAALLRAAIRSEEFEPGSTLPGEPELAERYGVTRAVVNRALGVLRSEGLVRPERGRGTTVNPLPIIHSQRTERQDKARREAGQARGAFAAELAALGLESDTQSVVSQEPAPAHVAEILGIGVGETVLVRRRVMSANGIPVMLADSYFPWDIAEGTQLAEVETGPGGAYSRLADLGHGPAEFTEEVTVRSPVADEARKLGMDIDQRVYGITRVATSAEGRKVEVNMMVLLAHQFKLSYTWPAG